jgi:hypothetical protein
VYNFIGEDIYIPSIESYGLTEEDFMAYDRHITHLHRKHIYRDIVSKAIMLLFFVFLSFFGVSLFYIERNLISTLILIMITALLIYKSINVIEISERLVNRFLQNISHKAEAVDTYYKDTKKILNDLYEYIAPLINANAKVTEKHNSLSKLGVFYLDIAIQQLLSFCLYKDVIEQKAPNPEITQKTSNWAQVGGISIKTSCYRTREDAIRDISFLDNAIHKRIRTETLIIFVKSEPRVIKVHDLFFLIHCSDDTYDEFMKWKNNPIHSFINPINSFIYNFND